MSPPDRCPNCNHNACPLQQLDVVPSKRSMTFARFKLMDAKPTARSIVDVIARDIAGGQLPEGVRLAPVRDVALEHGVSKNTVHAAYAELTERGLLVRSARTGFFVAKNAPTKRVRTQPRKLPLPKLHVEPLPSAPFAGANGPIALSQVWIDHDLLPFDRAYRCVRDAATETLPRISDPQGYLPLRTAISKHLRKRGIHASPDEVITTTGSHQALDLVSRALESRVIATESPTYRHALALMRANRVRVIGLPVPLLEPLDVSRWRRALGRSRPSFFYVIPSFQNPTGHSYSSAELGEILSFAEREGIALLEDDWGSELLPGSELRMTLRALGGENVLYVNSFTKKVAPPLRVGFIVAPRALVPDLVRMKRLATLATSTVVEAGLALFLERGYFEQHLRQLQREMAVRYANCLRLLEEFPDGVRYSRPGGGPMLWIEVPKSVDLDRLAKNALQRGVDIDVRTDALAAKAHLHGFPIGYAALKPEKLEHGLGVIRDLLG